jgi:hypothetical protein
LLCHYFAPLASSMSSLAFWSVICLCFILVLFIFFECGDVHGSGMTVLLG